MDAISGGATDTPYAHVKGEAILSGSDEPSFELNGAIKDLPLIYAAARGAGVRGDVVRAVLDRFEAAGKAGHGRDDMGAVHTAFLPAPQPATQTPSSCGRLGGIEHGGPPAGQNVLRRIVRLAHCRHPSLRRTSRADR